MPSREIATGGGFWGNVSPGVKEKLVIGGTLLVFGGLTTYVLYRIARRHRSQAILKNALYDGSLASLVEKIDVALVGAGTDEQKVFEAFADIETQEQAGKVIKMYKDAYSETLDEALRGDLDTEELQTVKNIISSKPRKKGEPANYNLVDDWTRRLKAAKGTFSTDEDSIYAVLWEVPDYKGLSVLSNGIASDKSVGYNNLPDYLNGQLGEDELEHAKYIMNRKKKSDGSEK